MARFGLAFHITKTPIRLSSVTVASRDRQMKAGPHQEFKKNVFINCPFDSEYKLLLRPILFTIVYFGFNPQIASQSGDSGEQRINKILLLIRKSKYSIHDLSRIRSEKQNARYLTGALAIPDPVATAPGSDRGAGDSLTRSLSLPVLTLTINRR